jgi:2-dehydro-3-deoxyphosphooctonate aldolase (KDO 8-P synthase)
MKLREYCHANIKENVFVKMHKVVLDTITFGNEATFVLIAGPCVIENEKSALYHAEKLVSVCSALEIPLVYKSSYDKANRTSVYSYRGPGLKKGLRILAKVKKTFGLPLLSDVHTVEDLKEAQEVLDIIQIPAFLCRQTDLIVAAAKSGKIVNIKKGQFVSPWEMAPLIEKVKSQGNDNILITERGFSFGYNNLVSDFRSIPIIRSMGVPVIFDATHSVQMPGGLGNASGGASEFIPTLARCAVAAGADGLFVEVHENPKKALCDGPNSLALKDIKILLQTLLHIKKALST